MCRSQKPSYSPIHFGSSSLCRLGFFLLSFFDSVLAASSVHHDMFASFWGLLNLRHFGIKGNGRAKGSSSGELANANNAKISQKLLTIELLVARFLIAGTLRHGLCRTRTHGQHKEEVEAHLPLQIGFWFCLPGYERFPLARTRKGPHERLRPQQAVRRTVPF